MPAALRARLRRGSDDCNTTPGTTTEVEGGCLLKLDADVQTAKLHYAMEIARIFALVRSFSPSIYS